MLVSHKTQDVISSMGDADLEQVLSEAITLFRDCKVIHDTLQGFKSGVISDDDAVDELDGYTVFNYDKLSQFKNGKCSNSPIVNKYLEKVFIALAALEKNLMDAVDCMLAITDEELDCIIDQAYRVTSGSLFFAISEFDVYSLQDNSGDKVDAILNTYCLKHGVEVQMLANELLDATEEFKIRLDLFDACPELEEGFHRLMGPHIIGVDEAYLTVDMIKAVVRGELAPDELAEHIAALQAQDEENE